jgi:hypothetical protein
MSPFAPRSRVIISDPAATHETHGRTGTVRWSTECAVRVVIDGGDPRGWTYPLQWVVLL